MPDERQSSLSAEIVVRPSANEACRLSFSTIADFAETPEIILEENMWAWQSIIIRASF